MQTRGLRINFEPTQLEVCSTPKSGKEKRTLRRASSKRETFMQRLHNKHLNIN